MADTSEIYARMAWEVLKRLLTSAHTVQSLADLTCIPVRRVRYLAEDPTKIEVEDYGRLAGALGFWFSFDAEPIDGFWERKLFGALQERNEGSSSQDQNNRSVVDAGPLPRAIKGNS